MTSSLHYNFCKYRSSDSTSGFTLIQVSILLTVAALFMVTLLPGFRSSLTGASTTAARLNTVMATLRQYQLTYGSLPCPADGSIATSASNFGVAAAKNGPTNNCAGASSPSTNANVSDSANHTAIGIVPVRTLGLSNDYALDGFGRYITYGVDTNATATNWATSNLQGSIIVTDYTADDSGVPTAAVTYNTVVALVSHGNDGDGAWLPVASGTGVQFNAGSTDTDELVNAHVNSSFVLQTTTSQMTGSNGNTTTFVKKPATSTFDDIVVYATPSWPINQTPKETLGALTVTPPTSGNYSAGLATLTFTVQFPYAVTVSGSPEIDLAVPNSSSSTISKAAASYSSGSGTSTLKFAYQTGFSDSVTATGRNLAFVTANSGTPASTNSNTSYPLINLNGGTITITSSGANVPLLAFTPPDLTGITISPAILYTLNSSAIQTYTIGASLTSTTLGTTITSNIGGAHATAITVDKNNYLWVAAGTVNPYYLYQLDTTGTVINTISTVAASPTSIAADTSSNIWYNNGSTNSTIYTTAGGGSSFGAGATVKALTITSGNAVYAEEGGSLNLFTTTGSSVSSVTVTAAGSIVTDPSQNIWAVSSGGSLYPIPSGSTSLPTAKCTGISSPGGVAVDSSGNEVLVISGSNVMAYPLSVMNGSTCTGSTTYTPSSTPSAIAVGASITGR